MKRFLILSLVMCCSLGGLTLNAQSTNQGDGATNAKVTSSDQNFLTVAYGLGKGNLLYWGLKTLEQAMPTDPDATLINAHVSKTPISFVKFEYRIKPKHSLGLNFAHNVFSVNGDLKDSFFYNDMGVRVQTTLGVNYTSTSCNIRYNYFFNPEDKVQCYIGASVGIRGNRISVTSNNQFFNKNINGLGLSLASVPTVGGDLTLGFRGDIYKSLMLFGEVGAAKAIIQGGLAYRF